MGKLVSYRMYTEGKESIDLVDALEMINDDADPAAEVARIIDEYEITEAGMSEEERVVAVAHASNKMRFNGLGISEAAALVGLVAPREVRNFPIEGMTIISLGTEGYALAAAKHKVVPVKPLTPGSVTIRLSPPV